MSACEMLTELMNSLSRLHPERFYVSYDDGEIGIMLTTFLNSLDSVRRTACGEDEDCNKLEQFFNFLWMLKWRGGCLKLYVLGNPPAHVLEKEYGKKMKVSYLSVVPTRPIYTFQLDVAKLAKELYEIYRRLCRPKPGMKQLIAEIVGDEVVEEIDSNVKRSRKRRKRRKREEELAKETEEVVESTEEVVNQEVYELIAK